MASNPAPGELELVRAFVNTYDADERREEFELHGELRAPTSALLPMGGAVSHVAGRNWALIGDAAACVNPLNGEGIDYGLESGRLARLGSLIALEFGLAALFDLLGRGSSLVDQLLSERYGNAASVRLTGKVVGQAPFKGLLSHRGWRATRVQLPQLAEKHDARVLAPAEVEL